MWQVAFHGRQPSTKAIVVSDLHGDLRRLREGLQWPVFKGLQWLEPPATYAHGNDEGVHQVSVMLGCDKPPPCLPAQSPDTRDTERARFAFRGLRG